jgi:hypothetical protein
MRHREENLIHAMRGTGAAEEPDHQRRAGKHSSHRRGKRKRHGRLPLIPSSTHMKLMEQLTDSTAGGYTTQRQRARQPSKLQSVRGPHQRLAIRNSAISDLESSESAIIQNRISERSSELESASDPEIISDPGEPESKHPHDATIHPIDWCCS